MAFSDSKYLLYAETFLGQHFVFYDLLFRQRFVSFSLTKDEAFDVMSIAPTSYPLAVVGLVGVYGFCIFFVYKIYCLLES